MKRSRDVKNISKPGRLNSGIQADSDLSNEDSESEEDEDDFDNLIKMMFAYAQDLLGKFLGNKNFSETYMKIDATKALSKCRSLILTRDNDLNKIATKMKLRQSNDDKVPPGSNNVLRSLDDMRFLLSYICLELSDILYLENDIFGAKQQLQEATTWYPKCGEGCLKLAKLLKALALVDDDIKRVEKFLRKAVLAAELPEIACPVTPNTENAYTSKSDMVQIDKSSSNRGNINDDGDVEVEHEDEEEEERETLRQVFIKILQRERKAGFEAIEELALLLCQSGKFQDASVFLKKCGYEWRLSRHVLYYQYHPSSPPQPSPSTTSDRITDKESSKYLNVFDNFLPMPLLEALQQAFRPSSPFWSEHHYDYLLNSSRSVGYFSYLYPYKKQTAMNLVEQYIDYILPNIVEIFPDVADCSIAEWWVHTRPHACGHQLHFDSDETHIEDGGKPSHPVASCVVFLSDQIGGPTLVTNQRLGGALATKGWLCPPKLNRFAIFDANYLHGVIPGRGVPPTTHAPTPTPTPPQTAEAPPIPRRLTFMVGFWKQIHAKSRGKDSPGPGQPMPDATDTKYTWLEEVNYREALDVVIAEQERQKSDRRTVDPVEVNCVWEPVDVGARGLQESTSSESSSSSCNGSHTPRYELCFQGF